MSAPADAPPALGELIAAVGAEPLRPLLAELDRELAGFVAAPADGGTLAAQAHGLVGAAGGLGFLDLAERCREVEVACKSGRDWGGPLRDAHGEAQAARSVIARTLAA